MAKIAIIGSGFSGLSAAAYLAASGHQVDVFEQNSLVGGRARQFKTSSGYVFDMGPSWYWMPEVFEKFFNDFGHSVADFYELKLLDPAFDVVFKGNELLTVPAGLQELYALFESIEEGGAKQLEKFMTEAAYKYNTAFDKFIFKPGLSIREFADISLLAGALRLQVFSSFRSHVRKYFSNPKLIALMEFPVLFLGATPQKTPAMYSLMNYAGLILGTWYPKGGFGKVVEGMKSVAERNGAVFHVNSTVEHIGIENCLATYVVVNGEKIFCDGVIASADYHHVESKLLPKAYRNYDEAYWERKTFAPSCLIFYLGIKKKIASLNHHTLFFDEDIEMHTADIYVKAKWPAKPLFYVCCPSKSDDEVAPPGHENLFLLMPIAPGLIDTEEMREMYFHKMITRLELQVNEKIVEYIDFQKSYCVNDFVSDYNSYKGNAYGLANTLNQTAILKPKIINKKVANLFYAGQLSVPGPGVPPSIISGKIASELTQEYLSKRKHEVKI